VNTKTLEQAALDHQEAGTLGFSRLENEAHRSVKSSPQANRISEQECSPFGLRY